MESLATTESLLALATLTGMEIVLGIDNIVFIAILVSKLPRDQQDRARTLGISLALIMRLALLFSISWIMQLTDPFFYIFNQGLSGRDLILVSGGLFLIGKATIEIHEKLEHPETNAPTEKSAPSINSSKNRPSKLRNTLLQIMLVDIVFSLDSVITAVGMAEQISIMVIAMIIAVGVMLIAAKSISNFVLQFPTLKILALSFLILIGVMLTAEGLGNHVNKGYIYFAMAFSLVVETLNIRFRTKSNDPSSPNR